MTQPAVGKGIVYDYLLLWPRLLIPLTPQTMPDSFRSLLSTTGFWKYQKTETFFPKTN
jgi:hypothetical protein